MEFGLIGEKLGHSFSREIHTRLCGYEYELRELKPEELTEFLRKREFRGINVTIPYKESVIPYLDGISERAAAIGAVNTVVNRGGKLFGDNTDFAGMEALLRREGIVPAGRKVLILGSGGTSKTATAVATAMGAGSIFRVSRKKQDNCITYEEAYGNHSDAEIIINATPVGMYPNGGVSPIDVARFPKLCGVVDAIYNPLRTSLVLAAKERGIPATGGLYMLVAQAAAAAELFVGGTVPQEDTERVYRELLAQKESIVLTGMPGAGKTTVGRMLAKQLGREFVDTDDVIVRESGTDIPTIFRERGEAGFREIEADVIRRVSAQGGIVLATGGGAVLRAENVAALRSNGRLFWLDRPIEKITAFDGRPLSADRKALEARFAEREPIYRATCDVHIAADGSPEAVAAQITAQEGSSV
ncbi:MAG: shikimate dehydrogenase [Lachnospiraceae bacterium]|nr:shikimate dehydrogenase [Lachnospiraceae bacterium]